jgi:hypothetical protein
MITVFEPMNIIFSLDHVTPFTITNNVFCAKVFLSHLKRLNEPMEMNNNLDDLILQVHGVWEVTPGFKMLYILNYYAY